MDFKRFILLIFALATLAMPAYAVPSADEKAKNLNDLRITLKEDYLARDANQQAFLEEYTVAQERIMNVIDRNEDLPRLLYTQDPDYTFNLAWILKQISQEYNDFLKESEYYDHIFHSIDFEQDRYQRLIRSLEQRPVEPELEACRDSCHFYATELLASYQRLRDTLWAGHMLYHEAVDRLKETDEYVQSRFNLMQDHIFKEGQTSWAVILSDPKRFIEQMEQEMDDQYNNRDLLSRLKPEEYAMEDEHRDRSENTLQLFAGILLILILMLYMLVCILLFRLIARIFPFGRSLSSPQKTLIGLLAGCLIFLIVRLIRGHSDDIFINAMLRMVETFVFLLTLIVTSLLVRVKPQQLKESFRLYLPSIFTALLIILCRVSFMPDKLMTLILAPILLLLCIRQAVVCIRYRRRTARIDIILGWISLAVTAAAMVVALCGYTFAAMLILMWWFFQLVIILTVQCLVYLLRIYKEKRMNPRINKYHQRIARLTGLDKNSLLFGFTWFYDLIAGVILPLIVVLSIPLCIQLTMDVFDFNKLFHAIYQTPFIHLTDKEGADVFRLSFRGIIMLVSMFFVFRYLDKMIHSLWQSYRYAAVTRKSRRKTVRSNEINLSLGNSVISVLVWLVYIAIVVVVLRIPLGSMTLIAGGLSAGIGLALKDTINNFLYGIQLMSGRLRVGDYIECDGIRGKVTAISYQNTQLQTMDDNLIVFTNTTLFSKNFKNLSRGSAYEAVKIPFSVSYESDLDRVRAIMQEASQALMTKDRFDRDVVDPKRGIKVALVNFGDDGIDLALSQYVLVEERNGYIGRARYLIYKTLKDNGIDMPMSQVEVHMFNS